MTKRQPLSELLPSPETLVANIVATYARATPAELENGADWYAYAHLLASELDRKRPKRAAGVLAALSPQTSWNENVKLARRAYSSFGPSGQTRANVGKCVAILKGEPPLDVLGGNKVRAFYACIIEPHTTDAVCVDRHAVAIALGADGCARLDPTWTEGYVKLLERKGGYDAIADAYRKAAAELGLQPHVVQAVTWLVHRREIRPNDSTISRFELEASCESCERIVSRCSCADERANPADYF